MVRMGIGLLGLGCGGSTAGVVPAAGPGPERGRAVGSDSLRLEAVWSEAAPVPEGVAISYRVTWSRNGEQVGSDTTTKLSRGAEIRRMGNGIPDTVLVTLWTLNHGVPSQRASWKEQVYRPRSAKSDTIELGPAPAPETRIPRTNAQVEAPDSAEPTAEPASGGDPMSPPAQRAPKPVAPAPQAVAVPAAAPSRAIQPVVVRVMNPPPSWASRGWDRDCPAGIRPEGQLTLVILPETPERCKPYVASYGTTPE